MKHRSAELAEEGLLCRSELLEVGNVELLEAHVDDGGRPVILLSADTEETYHVQDTEGKDLYESAEDYIVHVRHAITLLLDENNQWVVCGWEEQAEKRSW